MFTLAPLSVPRPAVAPIVRPQRHQRDYRGTAAYVAARDLGDRSSVIDHGDVESSVVVTLSPEGLRLSALSAD